MPRWPLHQTAAGMGKPAPLQQPSDQITTSIRAYLQRVRAKLHVSSLSVVTQEQLPER
jgi:hypothetical protein